MNACRVEKDNSLTYVVYEVFVISKHCCFDGMERPELFSSNNIDKK